MPELLEKVLQVIDTEWRKLTDVQNLSEAKTRISNLVWTRRPSQFPDLFEGRFLSVKIEINNYGPTKYMHFMIMNKLAWMGLNQETSATAIKEQIRTAEQRRAALVQYFYHGMAMEQRGKLRPWARITKQLKVRHGRCHFLLMNGERIADW